MNALPSPELLSGKDLAVYYFVRVKNTKKTWKCRACSLEITMTGSGYTNLCSHIYSKHNEYVHLGQDKAQNKQTLDEYWATSKAQKIHGWIDIIVNGLHPFSICEDKLIGKYSKLDGMDRDTLQKYMRKLTESVEIALSALLPNKFALVFDGWTAQSTHY
ncbi:unnamed protein product, partial [Aphanomyces euteiches]